MKVVFEMERATKNTIRFNEVLENDLETPKIGVLYVQKATLGAMDYQLGERLVVTLEKEA